MTGPFLNFAGVAALQETPYTPLPRGSGDSENGHFETCGRLLATSSNIVEVDSTKCLFSLIYVFVTVYWPAVLS